MHNNMTAQQNALPQLLVNDLAKTLVITCGNRVCFSCEHPLPATPLHAHVNADAQISTPHPNYISNHNSPAKPVATRTMLHTNNTGQQLGYTHTLLPWHQLVPTVPMYGWVPRSNANPQQHHVWHACALSSMFVSSNN
jgi:hypothetical protein